MSTGVEQEQGKTVIDTAKDEKLQEMPQNTKEKANKVPELSNTCYGYGMTAEASTPEWVSQVGEITKRPKTFKDLWFVYFKEPEQNEENDVGSLTKQWAESLFINEEIKGGESNSLLSEKLPEDEEVIKEEQHHKQT